MDLFTKKKYVIYFDYESCDDVKYRDLRPKKLTFCTDDLLHAIVTCGMPIYYCRTRSAADCQPKRTPVPYSADSTRHN